MASGRTASAHLCFRGGPRRRGPLRRHGRYRREILGRGRTFHNHRCSALRKVHATVAALPKSANASRRRNSFIFLVERCGMRDCLIGYGASRSDVEYARSNLVIAAKYFLDASMRSGYRVPLPAVGGRYPWGSNSFVLNNGVVLALAHDFTKQRNFLEGAIDALNYILGRNPMAKSYVTLFGTRPVENPHHRFWACQANSQFPCPPPGIVSGGPNSGVEDPAAKAAGLGGCAPQKCYFDNVESWSTNEVAINWNAPLAWLAAFADEKAQESSARVHAQR